MMKTTTETDQQPAADWQTRLHDIYELMREMSLHTDPQAMVRAYGERVRKLFPVDRRISLSRRGLKNAQFRITRYSEWPEEINPWEQRDRLPLLEGGLFADLIYDGQPVIIDNLDVASDDPAAPYVEGQHSLMALPMFDNGESLNMVILMRKRPGGFDRETFPDFFWTANLFGRATHSLVLKEQLRAAYESVDRELKVVSSIQRSLLPKAVPEIPGLHLAAYYQTSQRAGGDYYDFFRLSGGRWGILIADVSGHGTPAAVMMAITHSIAHLCPHESGQPEELLAFVNSNLAQRYTEGMDAFVTAFYGIYDPSNRQFVYSSAGHNPPRLWKCGEQRSLPVEGAASLPLGVLEDTKYTQAQLELDPGDKLVLYTDGITEAMDAGNEQFGVVRLDEAICGACRIEAEDVVGRVVNQLEQHTGHAPPSDDRTLVVITTTSDCPEQQTAAAVPQLAGN
jgi:sigma-B regulation protein RsbU (phosphoserine phosphatase)